MAASTVVVSPVPIGARATRSPKAPQGHGQDAAPAAVMEASSSTSSFHLAAAGSAGPDHVSGLARPQTASGLAHSQTARRAALKRKRKRNRLLRRSVARTNAHADLEQARRMLETGMAAAFQAIEDAHAAVERLLADEGEQD